MARDLAHNRRIQEPIFSEKIYSDDPIPDRIGRNIDSLDIHRQECGSYLREGKVCDKNSCFNRSFFSRIGNFSFNDRIKFIGHQVSIRKDKKLFIEELKGALYDVQNELDPNIYRHYVKILNDQMEKLNLNNSGARVQGKKAFIIHGHDNEMKRDVQLYMNRVGLDDVVLHEQADKGRTIIEKLIGESEGACYAVALFSPDDIMKDGTVRARQNVILEMGYFIGLLGRDRVKILTRKNVEIPSDFAGIVYTEYDEQGAWRIFLAKEMSAVGIKIDQDALLKRF